MSTYFVGVDFGTVHTKVCIREDIDQYPSAVVVDEEAEGASCYLLPSIPADWAEDIAPKVILCGHADVETGREERALKAAATVLAKALRAAIRHADGRDPHDGGKKFRLNLGLPTEDGVMVDNARHRYLLIAEEAIREVGDSRVFFSRDLLDERLASLVLLRFAKMEIADQPLLVVDGGGWTTHVSLLRWVSSSSTPSVSIHGDSTATHGVQQVVNRVSERLKVEPAEAANLLDLAMQAAYSSGEGVQAAEGKPLFGNSAVGAYARLRRVAVDRAQEELRILGSALSQFARAGPLHDAWRIAWTGGYQASPSNRHFRNYWLFLAGGAARIGRDESLDSDDPIATSLRTWQSQTGIGFDRVVYPELDPAFWTFSPKPDARAVPYLFVAGGYCFPHYDWPASIQRTVITMEERRPERRFCPCGGISENCPMCGGTGDLSTGQTPRASDEQELRTRSRAFAVIGARTEWLCEVCTDIVSSDSALAHFNTHVCSHCSQPFPDRRKHLMEVHGYVACPDCGRLTDRLARHRSKAHPTPQPEPKVPAPRETLSPPGGSLPATPKFKETKAPVATSRPAEVQAARAKAELREQHRAAEQNSESAPAWPPPVDWRVGDSRVKSAKRAEAARKPAGQPGPRRAGTELRHKPFADLKKLR